MNLIHLNEGAVFMVKGNYRLQLYMLRQKDVMCLYENRNKTFYALIVDLSESGFIAGRAFFNRTIKLKIKFSDCELVANQDI